MPNNEDKQGCCEAPAKTEKATTEKCGCGCSTKDKPSVAPSVAGSCC